MLKWEDKIGMDLNKIWYECVNWIQNSDQLQALLNSNKPPVSIKKRIISWPPERLFVSQ
jgi:hypothetical protein